MNTLMQQAHINPTADQFFYINNVLGLFRAMVECATTVDPTYSDPPIAWEKCITDDIANGASPAYSSIRSGIYCFQKFAYTIHGDSTYYVPCTDAFSDACISALNLNQTTRPYHTINSPLMMFYRCSGYQLNTESTVCEENDEPVYSTYVPFMAIAVAAETPLAAGRKVLEYLTEIAVDKDATLSCSSCYSALAAELNAKMTEDKKNLCKNPYAEMCEQSYVVQQALKRFKICAGFELTSSAPAFTCSPDEWGIIREKEVVAAIMNLVGSVDSGSAYQGLIALDQLFVDVKDGVNKFRCKTCFEDILVALYELEKTNFEICKNGIASAACYASAGAHIFAKFQTCAGHQFVL